MAAYLLNQNILENVINSVYLILCFEMAMWWFNPLHFSVIMHIELEINPCTIWPHFKFFENVVILEITLQDRGVHLSHFRKILWINSRKMQTSNLRISREILNMKTITWNYC